MSLGGIRVKDKVGRLVTNRKRTSNCNPEVGNGCEC